MRTTLLACLLALACRNAAPEPPAAAPAPMPAPPLSPHAGAMPAGHPPVGAAAPPSAPERALRWSDPVGWRRVQPSSAMRRAQYAVPGPGGEAEVTVFYFGSGQGGSIDENLRRWHGQIEAPAGAPATDSFDEVRPVSGLQVHLTGRHGRFGAMAMPGAPAPAAREDQALLGAIAETPDGPWFFKMTGPRATVDAARRGFDDLVASFQFP